MARLRSDRGLVPILLLVAGCSTVTIGPPPPPPVAFRIIGERTSSATGLRRMVVVVAPGTSRDDLDALRAYLDERHRSVSLLQITFYDEESAAQRCLDGARPAPADGDRLLAQWLRNDATRTRWWGRPAAPGRAVETW